MKVGEIYKLTWFRFWRFRHSAKAAYVRGSFAIFGFLYYGHATENI